MTSRLKQVNCTRKLYTGKSWKKTSGPQESPGNLLISSDKVFIIYVIRNLYGSWKDLILKYWEIWRPKKINLIESWKSPWNLFLKKGTNPVVTLHHHDFLNPSRYCTMAERQVNSQPDLGKHKVLLHIKCELFIK